MYFRANNSGPLTFTATPTPSSQWPTYGIDYPTWYVDSTKVQEGGSSYTFNPDGKDAAVYTIKAKCGTSVKAIDVYVVTCQYQIAVEAPSDGAISITWYGNIPVAFSVGHASWRLNVVPSNAINVVPLKTYASILRKNVGFHANSQTVILSGETLAPTPTLHVPDSASGKLKTYDISLINLLAGAAHTASFRASPGDYRLGTYFRATKFIHPDIVTLIDWNHTSSRNCASTAVAAGGACGETLPSPYGTWMAYIGGVSIEYRGDMPFTLCMNL